MRSHFNFFLKASKNNFTFEVNTYAPKLSLQKSNFVFLSNDDQNVKIHDLEDVIKVEIGYPSLGFALIEWDKKKSDLKVEIDELGQMSIFQKIENDQVCISNRPNNLERTSSNNPLSDDDIHFFLETGFSPVGRTFFQNQFRIGESSKWNEISLDKKFISAEDILESLEEGIFDLKQEVKPNHLRLSGGADTRIVSLLWKEKIGTSSVLSPWMNEREDRDVNIAKAWAEKLAWPHQILKPSIKEFAFFMNENSTPYLTGICGGEFLGGQFHRVIPSNPQTWNLERLRKNSISDSSWFQGSLNNQEVWHSECAQIFLKSYRSTIYDSVWGSWSSPQLLQSGIVSPFTTRAFLKTFLRIPVENLGDYDLYGEIFDLLGTEAKSLPLSSQFNLKRPELRPDASWGKEPKALQPKGNSTVKFEEVYNFVKRLFEEQNLKFCSADLRYFSENSKNRLNLWAFYFWSHPRFKHLDTNFQ